MGKIVTLDDDVAERIEAEARRTGATPQEIVNTTLRRSLKDTDIEPKPFKIRPRHMGQFLIGVECTSRALTELEQLELEDREPGSSN